MLPKITPHNAIPYPSPVPREIFCIPINPVIIEINDKGTKNPQGQPVVNERIPVTKEIIASVWFLRGPISACGTT